MTELETDTKAVIETRLVHDTQRRATTLLAGAAARASAPRPAVEELRQFVVASLQHHHRAEDHELWPLIVAAAPDLSGPLGELSAQHEQLDAALIALGRTAGDDRRAVATAAGDVCRLVHDHLGREEPVLLPALVEHVTDEAWESFSQRTIATAPTEGAHLFVGFFDRVGTAEHVDLVLAGLPEPARALIPENRRRARDTLEALEGATA
jgi:hemerythrin-like domain-containing protein